MNKYLVAIVGATGLVGETLLKIFEEEKVKNCEIDLYASEKSVNKLVKYNDRFIAVKSLAEANNRKYDFVFFMTDKEITLKYIHKFKRSAYIIDNSSAFRLNKDTPLVIPEINFKAVNKSKIISNPNCTTAICSIPIYLIASTFGVKRINATTFQAVSGSGKLGIKSLQDKSISEEIYNLDINKTCLPKIGDFAYGLYTEEEHKFIDEMRKILCDYDLPISATCVRVPIQNCHAASISLTLKNKPTINEIKALLSKNNQIVILGDEDIPSALLANNSNRVYLGRLRWDFSLDNTLLFFIYGDNLRRGAAYNAYRIMEYIINDSL